MLRELAKSIREFKRPSILAPVLVSCEVMLECIILFIVARLVNQIKGRLQHRRDFVARPGAGGDGGAVPDIRLAGRHRLLQGVERVRPQPAADLFSKIQTYSFENIDKFSTSSLVTRLTTDVTNVQMAYMMIIRTAIRCPLMLVFAFVMAFVMGGQMAFIFLIVAPILGFGLFAVIRKVMPLFKKVFHKYDVLNNSIQENIKGIRVVKSFVREDYEKKNSQPRRRMSAPISRGRKKSWLSTIRLCSSASIPSWCSCSPSALIPSSPAGASTSTWGSFPPF